MDSTAPTGSITYALQSLLNTMSGNCNRTSPQALFNEIIERFADRSYYSITVDAYLILPVLLLKVNLRIDN